MPFYNGGNPVRQQHRVRLKGLVHGEFARGGRGSRAILESNDCHAMIVLEPDILGNKIPAIRLSSVTFNKGVPKNVEPEPEQSGSAKPDPRPEARPAIGRRAEAGSTDPGSEPPGPNAQSRQGSLIKLDK